MNAICESCGEKCFFLQKFIDAGKARIRELGEIVASLFRREEKNDDISLTEAAVIIAGRVGLKDSFNVQKSCWRHEDRKSKPRFQVSIFKGFNHLAAQINDENLSRAVERALLAWEADPAQSSE